jgi:hypothetical protein
MSAQDERPVSGSTVLLVTALTVLGAIFVVRWIVGTVTFLFNTVVLVAVVAGVAYLYLKARER